MRGVAPAEGASAHHGCSAAHYQMVELESCNVWKVETIFPRNLWLANGESVKQIF
jgi:hypothetical protein